MDLKETHLEELGLTVDEGAACLYPFDGIHGRKPQKYLFPRIFAYLNINIGNVSAFLHNFVCSLLNYLHSYFFPYVLVHTLSSLRFA